MIVTDEQRRWWFANHPEFSSSHKGGRSQRRRDADSSYDKIDPREVDAYVDEALKYESGPLAELLKSVKRNFGTEGVARQPDDEWAESGWETEAGGRVGPRQGSRRGPDPRRGLDIRDWIRVSRAERRARDEIEDELEQAGINRHDYRLTSHAGKMVARRDGLFDPYQVDHQGRTNVQRIEENLAPLGRDGKPIVLHHVGQRAEGPIIEMTQAEHRAILVRQNRSEIDRPDFRIFRETYWRARRASIRMPDPDLREFYIRRKFED